MQIRCLSTAKRSNPLSGISIREINCHVDRQPPGRRASRDRRGIFGWSPILWDGPRPIFNNRMCPEYIRRTCALILLDARHVAAS